MEAPKLNRMHKTKVEGGLRLLFRFSVEELKKKPWSECGKAILREDFDARLVRLHAAIEHFRRKKSYPPKTLSDLPNWAQGDVNALYRKEEGEIMTPLQKAVIAHLAMFSKGKKK